jgi:hypothetical protein
MDDATLEGFIASLSEAAVRAEAAAREVPEGRWDDVVHTGDGAWTRRQLLAHIACNDLRQLVRIRIGAGIPEPDDAATHAAELDVVNWNAARVAERAGRSVEELVQEMRANRAAQIALLRSLTPAQRARPMPFRGVPTPLGEAIPLMLGHLSQHVGELTAGIEV